MKNCSRSCRVFLAFVAPLVASLLASAAAPVPQESLTIDLGRGVTMEFVLVRPGSFEMGSEDPPPGMVYEEVETPVHKVTLSKPFYLARYEVTQEQWEAVMGSNPSRFKGPKNPVENVSWEDCHGFLGKLKGKVEGWMPALPTEAQWEYACRAGSTTAYCFGDDEGGLGEYAWYDANSENRTHPVGEKKPNAWGFYDMHGNVWEWCADWFGSDYYGKSPGKDPTGPQLGALNVIRGRSYYFATGNFRVVRGGSWCDQAKHCRSAFRGVGLPTARVGLQACVIFGFRPALVPSGG